RSVHVPQSIRIAIQARLARLPEDAQEILRRASIVGREFDYDVLKATADLDEDRLIDALEIGERAQLIEEIHPPGERRTRARPRFTFVHALIPHTLAEGISGLRRQRLHRRVGEALEQSATEDRDELAGRIGRHFAEAGEWDRAAEYFLRAGDHAQSVYAYREAIAAYEEALGIVRDRKETDREARTLMKLGSLYHSILDFPRSRRAYQEAFALWEVAGSGGASPPPPPTDRPLLVFARNPETLDPNIATDVNHLEIVDQLFSGLVERTPEMDIVPDVARSWEISEGGRRYTFHLRPDVFWSDGVQVTSKDFEFSLKRILDPSTGSRNAGFLYDITGAEAYHRGKHASPESIGIHAPDPLTLQFDLACPAGYFLHLLAHATAFPVPAHVVTAHGPQWWHAETLVTNGPFLMERWEPKKRIAFSRNPRFHGRTRGNAQRLEATLWEAFDADRALRQYEADEVTCMRVPSTTPTAFLERHKSERISEPSAQVTWVSVNPKVGPFQDRRVRLAFAHACDRKVLTESQRDQGETTSTGGFIPEGLPGHIPNLAFPFDPDRARALLAEAGFPDGRDFPVVDFLAIGLQPTPPQLEKLRARWSSILNVEVRLITETFERASQRIRETPPALMRTAWLADFPDPDNFLRLGFGFYGDLNWDPRYADLVDQARCATDLRHRMALYQQADRLLIQEAAAIPLLYGRVDYFVKPWVRSLPFSPVRTWYWKDAVLE
ncbi:MAG TPA: ABC transporter substrate-binding protein, partial [Anaerolineales bacterium]|nr:ABC transporter substrate-binding protein [Anaerolineales bacterium]